MQGHEMPEWDHFPHRKKDHLLFVIILTLFFGERYLPFFIGTPHDKDGASLKQP